MNSMSKGVRELQSQGEENVARNVVRLRKSTRSTGKRSGETLVLRRRCGKLWAEKMEELRRV